MLSREELARPRLSLDDRAALVAFRLVAFVLLAFFLLYSDWIEAGGRLTPFWLLAAYLASNGVLLKVPSSALQRQTFQAGLLLFDIAVVTSAIYLSQGWDSDLYLVYFLVIFMSSLDASLPRSFATATVACGVYVGMALKTDVDWTATSFLLRIPFFYLASFFAAFLAGQARGREEKRERSYTQKLEAAERREAIGRLAREIAKEIGDPLRVISGLSAALNRQSPEGDPRRPTLDAISSETRRCESLLRRFLLLTSDAVPPLALVDVNSAAREALETLRGSKGWPPRLEVKLDLSGSIPPVRGDRGEIVLALANLLQNALDAMPQGGTLTLRSRRRREADLDRVLIEVGDTGAGIPEFARDRMFEPFFTTKRRLKRLGLGLCFVSAIVERHRGALDYETTAGKGTKFALRFSPAD